jgi:acyl carrier protein
VASHDIHRADLVLEVGAMPLDACQLGLEGTKSIVRQILIDRFQIAAGPEAIPPDDPLFAVGVGLSSLEGMELLVELEKQFGVRIKNVDWWASETPTLNSLSQYVMELSRQQGGSSDSS